MANTTPLQLCLKKGKLVTEFGKDNSFGPDQIYDYLKKDLGSNFKRIEYKKSDRVVYGKYTNKKGQNFYIQVANLTFMGGTEGQHPLDLKRIQYNVRWRDFYEKYSTEGKVLWLGFYKNRSVKVWAFFEPETYLKKHKNSPMISKGGHTANYSCHIFLNDLLQGIELGSNNSYFKKTDKNSNIVGAIKFKFLKQFFEGDLDSTNPIIETIKTINNEKISWNKWIIAKDAIPYMKGLKDKTGFKDWKQNMWNGWYVEGIYSEYLHDKPSPYIHYISTTVNQQVKDEYKDFGLDLAFPEQKYHFIGDLKAISEGDEETYLNDETNVNKALKNFKKIWFVFYLHEKKKGNTNNYEMVKWRNHFIQDSGEWDSKKKFNEKSAPSTPHSIFFTQMVIIELNDVTKPKYFKLRHQGHNSNGKARKDKYSINKKILKIINDDSFVIARYPVP